MKILLINLTRFGDQLQGQAAVNALARFDFSGSGFACHGLGGACQPGGQNSASDTGTAGAGSTASNFSGAGSLGTSAPGASTAAFTAAGMNEACLNEICLVCLPNFAGASALLNNIFKVYPLPRGSFLNSLERGWSLAVGELQQWADELWQSFEPDYICNLTPSISARLLSGYLARGKKVEGFGLDEFGFGLSNLWGEFLQNSSGRRALSPFNIVDLFRAVALPKVLPDAVSSLNSTASPAANQSASPLCVSSFELKRPDVTSLAAAGVLLEQCYRDKYAASCAGKALRGFVGLQLGASADARRWPVENFACLGDAIAESGFVPVLLGSPSEKKLADEYAQKAVGQFISLVGETDMQMLAAVLCNTALLISNDTGTMHLAAGLGVKVLGFFLATAQPWDTGPYLEGCCSLEPDLPCHPCAFTAPCPNGYTCRSAITPELPIALVLNFLTQGEWLPAEGISDSKGENITSALPKSAHSATPNAAKSSSSDGEPEQLKALNAPLPQRTNRAADNSLTSTGAMANPPADGECFPSQAGGLLAAGAQLKSFQQVDSNSPRVWVSQKNSEGLMGLRSISNHEHEFRSIWMQEQQLFLRQFLDRTSPGSFVLQPQTLQGAPGVCVPPVAYMSAGDKEKITGDLSSILASLSVMLEFGRLLQVRPLPLVQERFLKATNSVYSLLGQSEFFGSIAALWQSEVLEHGVELGVILAVAKDYKSLFEGILSRISV